MEPTENKQTGGRRAAHIERLRKKYPEKRFEDDEEIFGQTIDDFDQIEQENSAMKEREKALSDMFASDPRAAYFMNDWREGKDPVLGLVKRFGPEIKNLLDDPEMEEKIKEESQGYIERLTNSRKLDEEFDRNMPESLKALELYQQQTGASDEEIDAIGAAWLQILQDGLVGKLSKDTIALIGNALKHDSDVSAAREAGETAGRNAKIDMKLRKKAEGDGVTALGGGNNSPSPRRGKTVFDTAREF